MQEINNSLVKKIRDLEVEYKSNKTHKSLKQENKKLVKEVQELKSNLKDAQKIIEVINSSYDSLVESSRNFEEKTRSLVDINERLKTHIISLLPSDQL